MAKNMTILAGIYLVIVIETFLIASSNGVPIILMAFPIDQEIPSSPLSSPITVENVKRVHRRALERQPELMTKQQVDTDDDLETAAGTNVLRPLFVYRQQMAYRDRNNRRLAARRRAIPDYY